MPNTFLDRSDAIFLMNQLGRERTPFLFYTDFLGLRSRITALSEVVDTYYDFRGNTNYVEDRPSSEFQYLEKFPISFDSYKIAFDIAQQGLRRGDSYLMNLTFPTPITSNLSALEIFENAKARYKLHVPGEMTLFSPETFVEIGNNQITTYPMKGTIDARIPGAKAILLNDKKELAEHSTIVDLMRNDLSMVSSKVIVEKFRYVDQVKTSKGALLQVSSKITGQLEEDFMNHLGSILYKLLPAGSISGAPKKKTIELIQQAEQDDRGWYTGICGIFDGNHLDSGVMIRYIEDKNEQLIYRSGGGITAQSSARAEYQELIDKIYVPIHREHSNQRWTNPKPVVS